MSMELSEAHISFVYPPRAPSAHPRSWATTSEIAVEAKHLVCNLAQLINGASTEEEQEETPPMQESHLVRTINVQLIF